MGRAEAADRRDETPEQRADAINFRFDVRREPDPAGDRVVVTLNGKFLPYQW